ncbi:uncharacterized protein LOC135347820 isoform X4 [Halichondria panicea]|uniref:uncharacterized protein LOC135347820 isoform X4 n=1 Tax=Halichondria panicea TaxID=6063 RepID=UPI00312B85A9
MAELEISRSGQTHDMLHPLTSLEWEEMPSLPMDMINACSVYLNGTFYVGGWSIILYSFKLGVDSTWTVTDTPTFGYTLAVHDSELLLVGGRVYSTEEITTNKIFTMRDEQFVEVLPPMKEKRNSPSAVSSGSALVVAGGTNTSGALSSVEVFKHGQWTTAPSLPSAEYNMKSALHGDQWYLITDEGKAFCASLQSLISGDVQSPWETLPDAPNLYSAAAFFGGHLLSIGGGFPTRTPTIYAFSTFTQSWERAADLPLSLDRWPTAVVLSSKQLIVSCGARVLHGKFKVTAFDADSHFTLRAIDRLKASAGISLIEELVQHTSPTAFLAVAGMDVRAMYNHTLREWESGRGPHPPTWAELFRVLKEMGLSELAGRIEKYLRGSVPEDPPRPPPDDSKEEKNSEVHLSHGDKEQDSLGGESSVTELRAEMKRRLPEYESLEVELDKLTDEYDEQADKIYQLEKGTKIDCIISYVFSCDHTENEHLRNENHHLRAESKGLVLEKQELKVEPVKSEEPVSQLLPLELPTVQHHAIPFNLPGVEVVASTCVIVTNSPQTFHWVGYGFKLTIPQGSLPAGVDQCRLDIKASVAGQYQFPDNLQLISGVFWMRPYPSGQFQQQLTVEVQHCAKMTSSTKLSFVRAHCSQESLPYTFKQLEGRGSFTEHSSYGSLELSHFSGLAVTGEDVERVYTASLYYLGSELHSREIHFVVNWDNEIHNTLVSEKYSSKRAVLGVNHFVEFEEDSLTLDIPKAGAKVKGGWKITPMFHPTVIKKHVDQFKPGQRIPYCHLNAEMTNKRKKSTPKLFHQVKLVGAKVPYNFITINLDPQRTLPETTFGDLIKFKPIVSSQGIAVNEDDKGDKNQLGTKDLQEVFSNLMEVVTNWFNLGLSLGIQVGTLKAIKSNESNDQDRLREMLTHWLQYSPSRTWNDICNGLRSDTVKQINLADKIEEKYKEHSSRPHPLTGEKREATEHNEQVPPKRPRSEEQ